MRILIVDNNIMRDSWGATNLASFASQVPDATVHVRRAPNRDLPRDLLTYDRVVISGSITSANEDAPWISELEEAIRRWIDRGTHLLGVCYGHQMIGRALGGKTAVRRAAAPEFGWSRIEILENDPLLKGLEGSFYSFSSHYDEVCSLPQGARLLARSEICGVQAMALAGKPVWGIQFHPEKPLDECNENLSRKLKSGEPKNLLHPKDGEMLFDEKVGQTIFANFYRGIG